MPASDLLEPRLEIEVHNREQEIWLVLRGELDIGNAPELDVALLAAEETSAATIMLDLRGLEFLDSTGLRVILSAQLRCAVDGERLRLIPGPERVQRLFAITGTAELLRFEDGAQPPDNLRELPHAGGV